MYSLIIQNKDTTENFLEHYALFMDSLEKDEIGYCRWNEDGKTIETAVPELVDLTDGKEEWRAIIVLGFGDEKGFDSRNPFDFFGKKDKETIESDIPIIRLSQMLGGVPGPEIRYKGEVRQEEGKSPFYYFEPDYESEEYKLHLKEQKDLQEKYNFNGKLPAEVWLISPRKAIKNDELRETRTAWITYDETNNSEFWKRNGYPSVCRFMIYDYEEEGVSQKIADEFNFWTSVLLLSLNYIEPSSLQAYRLYSIRTEFNHAAMEQRFQTCANRAENVKGQLHKRIQKYIQSDLKDHAHNRSAVRKDIEIEPIELPSGLAGKGVSPNLFKLYADSEMEEMGNWRTKSTQARAEIEELVRTAERRLNERAERMREENRVDRKEVRLLDQYELEDSERSLSHYYDRILQLQKELPDTTILETPEEKAAATEISDFIRTRISKKRVVEAAGVVDICTFLLALPSIITYLVHGNYERALVVLFISLCFMLLVMVPMLFVLIFNRYRLRSRIRKYNELLNRRLGLIKTNEKAYTDFVNDIVVYSRGQDYIRVMKELEHAEDDAYTLLKKHLYAAIKFGNRIETWGNAYHISVTADENMSNTYVDTSVSPIHCDVYSLSDELSHSAFLNGGEPIVSPLDFVDRLMLTREELFDEPNKEETSETTVLSPKADIEIAAMESEEPNN